MVEALLAARSLVPADDRREGAWPRELRFYHGTSRAKAEAVLREGFQPEFLHDDCCLGRGVYVGRPDKALRFAQNKAWHGGDEGGLLEVLVWVSRPKFVTEDDQGWQAEGYDACRADHTSRSKSMEWCIANPAACKPTRLLVVPIDAALPHAMETEEWVEPPWAPALAEEVQEVQEVQEVREVEEVTTEQMEVATGQEVEVVAAAAPSSQLTPLAREQIRSAATRAVEAADGVTASWRCDHCHAAGNAPWHACQGCGQKKPLVAAQAAMTEAVKALQAPLDLTTALTAASEAAATQAAYGMGAMAGCAAGMQDATDGAAVPAAFGDCDAALLLGPEAPAKRVFVDPSAALAHLTSCKKRQREGIDPDELDTTRITRRAVALRPPPPRPPPPRPPPPRPPHRDDWYCGGCGRRVYHFRSACFQCGRPRRGYEAHGPAWRGEQRLSEPRRSSSHSSSRPSERSSRATSQMTLQSTAHLRQREDERAIVRRQLQACLKHGRRRRKGADKWEVEYDGVTLLTNDELKIGITAFWSGRGRGPAWVDDMERASRADRLYFPFDLEKRALPPLPEPLSPRGSQRSQSLPRDSPCAGAHSDARSAAPSRSASREPSLSRGGGGGGGGGGGRDRDLALEDGWRGTPEAAATMWWCEGEGCELRFAAGLSGAVFLTNLQNEAECLRRGLFGLPSRQAALVRSIGAARDSTLLFLFNFETKRMLGAFVAAGPAGFPLHKEAWAHGSGRTLFPSQLPVAWHGPRLRDLTEHRCRHVLRYTGDRGRFEQNLGEDQVHELIRLFLDDAPAGRATAPARPAPPLPPLAEEGAAEERDAAERQLQQQAHRSARALAERGGASEAATVWRCLCGRDALNWAPCPGCGADVPRHAMQAAIAGVRPVLDSRPDEGGGAASHDFRRGVLDGYAVGRSGLLTEHPAAYRLCDTELMPALPPPSAAVRKMLSA